MTNATHKFPVSYDNKAGNRFILQKAVKQLVFNGIPSGLYFLDVGDQYILMVATTTVNREGCTNC